MAGGGRAGKGRAHHVAQRRRGPAPPAACRRTRAAAESGGGSGPRYRRARLPQARALPVRPGRRGRAAAGLSPESPAFPSLRCCGECVGLGVLSLGSRGCAQCSVSGMSGLLPNGAAISSSFHKSIGRRSAIPLARLLPRVTARSRPGFHIRHRTSHAHGHAEVQKSSPLIPS